MKGNYYEKVERWTPAPAELEAMTGEYASDEAEVTFRVALENGHLVIHRRPDADDRADADLSRWLQLYAR